MVVVVVGGGGGGGVVVVVVVVVTVGGGRENYDVRCFTFKVVTSRVFLLIFLSIP